MQTATVITQSWGQDYYTFTCSCGSAWQTTATAKGEPSVYFRRSWKNHVDASAADPDEETIVGIVKKPRTTWTVKIISVNHQHATDYSENGRQWWKTWGTAGAVGWVTNYPYAVVVDRVSPRGKTSKALKTIAMNRTDALRKAQFLLDKEAQDFDVEYTDDRGAAGVPVIYPTFRNTFSDLLARTEGVETENLLEVETTLQEIDEVLSLVPVLQSRRDEIAAAFDKRTVGLIEQ